MKKKIIALTTLFFAMAMPVSVCASPIEEMPEAQTVIEEQYDSSEDSEEDASASDTQSIPEKAIEYALSKVGLPYSQARRNSGSAYDCSSLVYYSYLNAGIDLSYSGGNTAAQLAKGLMESDKEVSIDEMQPGDLIFYSYERNGRYMNISHVSMYLGDDQQVAASSSKKKVCVQNLTLDKAVCICRPDSEEKEQIRHINFVDETL